MGNFSDFYINSNKEKIEIKDPFRSLEDPFSESTIKWIDSENKIT